MSTSRTRGISSSTTCGGCATSCSRWGRARVVHVGGAGCALARALAAERPGDRQEVIELDPAVVELARAHLGLRRAPGLRVRVGDGRAVLAARPDGSADAVLIDAFVGAQVPRHLVTAGGARRPRARRRRRRGQRRRHARDAGRERDRRGPGRGVRRRARARRAGRAGQAPRRQRRSSSARGSCRRSTGCASAAAADRSPGAVLAPAEHARVHRRARRRGAMYGEADLRLPAGCEWKATQAGSDRIAALRDARPAGA